MNEVQSIAAEVAMFFHTLIENEIEPFTATTLTNAYIATRLQYGKFPDESPFIPFPFIGEDNNDDQH